MGANASLDSTSDHLAGKLLPWWGWLLLAVGSVVILGALGLAVFWPDHLVLMDKAAIPVAVSGNTTPDAYLKAITDTRTTLVQAVGGFAIFLGVIIGLLTLVHNRQTLSASLAFNRESLTKTMALTERGQITDRFTKAIEQLGRAGADAVDLRLGAIYALIQIAKESSEWRNPILEVLAAFVRIHPSGIPLPDGETLDAQLDAVPNIGVDTRWIFLRADIAAALHGLTRIEHEDKIPRIDLQRADFRRVDFSIRVSFERSNLNQARFDDARLMYSNMSHCYFVGTQLPGADLEQANLSESHLFYANLYRADLTHAQLKGAALRSVDLRRARNLTFEQLREAAEVDDATQLPDDIDRAALRAALAQRAAP